MIQPDKTFVLVKPEPLHEFKTESGIIITNPRTKTRKGEVMAIGSEIEGIKVGDVVTFFTIHSPEIEGMFLVDTNPADCRIVCIHPEN